MLTRMIMTIRCLTEDSPLNATLPSEINAARSVGSIRSIGCHEHGLKSCLKLEAFLSATSAASRSRSAQYAITAQVAWPLGSEISNLSCYFRLSFLHHPCTLCSCSGARSRVKSVSISLTFIARSAASGRLDQGSLHLAKRVTQKHRRVICAACVSTKSKAASILCLHVLHCQCSFYSTTGAQPICTPQIL